MSVLLETTLGDIVIDLDYKNSPSICHNFLKLVKARYYTNCLIYDVVQNRYCLTGDPRGDGQGGCSIYAYIDHILSTTTTTTNPNEILKHPKRFIKSSNNRTLTKPELKQKGMVCMTLMNHIKDTIGSQFLITLMDGISLDGVSFGDGGGCDKEGQSFFSLGRVVEDDGDVLDKINNLYCDKGGRPYTDVRIVRALIIHDPFEDPKQLKEVLQKRNIIENDNDNLRSSPNYNKPIEEIVEPRISALDSELQNSSSEDEETKLKKQHLHSEKLKTKEAKSRAIVLEMLGDIPTAEIKPPEDVLFVCKLNPVTQDEDLELIFSRFDNNVKCEVIREPETGQSLCYAFVEFGNKEACVEAYFKMNNALIDDRRIKVDFSQSVSKIWNRFYHFKRGAGGVMPRYEDRRGGGREEKERYDEDRHRERRRRDYSDDSSDDSSSRRHKKHSKRHKKHKKHRRHDHHRSRSEDRRSDDRRRKHKHESKRHTRR